LTPAGGRAEQQTFSLRLFQSSTTPLLIQSTIISQYCFMSRRFCAHWPRSLVAKFLGTWLSPDETFGDANSVPVSGLAYFLQAPRSLRQTLVDPVHTIIYLAITVTTAGFIARAYVEASTESPAELARSLKARHLRLPGHREDEKALEKKLSRDIPAIAALGGVLMSLLAFVSEILGAYGSGTSILLATSIVKQCVLEMKKEYEKSGKKFPL